MTARSRWGIGGSRLADHCGRRVPGDAAEQEFRASAWDTLWQCSRNGCIRLPGRVEGASETTQVGAAADGILKAVYVKEGQFVKRGTVLGEIACEELQASLQTAIAEADGARQTRTRILRGARDEEKKIATEKTAAARATFEEAKSRLEMQRALYQREQVSRSTFEQAVRDLGVADANLRAAVRTEEYLAAPPLQEEKARADADVLAAEGRIRTVQERIGKCSIPAPIDGTI